MTHDLKIWPVMFVSLLEGKKSWEYRKDNRNFEEGDILSLREWDPRTQTYTGRSVNRVVSLLVRNSFDIPKGYVIMSLEKEKMVRGDDCTISWRPGVSWKDLGKPEQRSIENGER